MLLPFWPINLFVWCIHLSVSLSICLSTWLIDHLSDLDKLSNPARLSRAAILRDPPAPTPLASFTRGSLPAPTWPRMGGAGPAPTLRPWWPSLPCGCRQAGRQSPPPRPGEGSRISTSLCRGPGPLHTNLPWRCSPQARTPSSRRHPDPKKMPYAAGKATANVTWRESREKKEKRAGGVKLELRKKRKPCPCCCWRLLLVLRLRLRLLLLVLAAAAAAAAAPAAAPATK